MKRRDTIVFSSRDIKLKNWLLHRNSARDISSYSHLILCIGWFITLFCRMLGVKKVVSGRSSRCLLCSSPSLTGDNGVLLASLAESKTCPGQNYVSLGKPISSTPSPPWKVGWFKKSKRKDWRQSSYSAIAGWGMPFANWMWWHLVSARKI